MRCSSWGSPGETSATSLPARRERPSGLSVYCRGDEAGCPRSPRAARRVPARRAPAVRHRVHPAPRRVARVVVRGRRRARRRRARRRLVGAAPLTVAARMMEAARLLALWLTPALWLAMPALILARGSEGLWIALALTVVPLIALAAPTAGARVPRGGTAARFYRAVLLAVAGVSIWANVGLAGDVAQWQGAPRWHG